MTAAPPEDLATLRAALAQAEARADVAEAEAARVKAHASNAEALIATLKLEIEKLRRELYGTRSERTARLLDQRKRCLMTRPRPFGFMKYSAGRRSAEEQHVGDGSRGLLAAACAGVAGERADAESLRRGAWDRPLGFGAVVAPLR